ncbi:hypothetical protein D9619_003309 [Psilocybe cf. subviscida]|uniref:Small EDRK-rich factor-like N-terminal domain-containing protein n=1 Tax=Psilocybe cf. subviscida TaxID=2480587 RepID=A0A8H5AW92_9AGAR|nr:hypothetical protein D9619_003309 [Psilocybe cf. subviscida]
MTRGNQRDQDRLKAQKKAASMAKKPTESASSLAKRKEAYVSAYHLFIIALVHVHRSDAEALRAKQKKKEEERAAAAAATSKKT